MPRKKVSNDAQSSALRQPTLAGFINTKSASMVNPDAKSRPKASTSATAKPPKSTTSVASTSKPPANSTSTAEPKIGPPVPRRRASKRGSKSERKRTRSPKKRARAYQKVPIEGSDDD